MKIRASKDQKAGLLLFSVAVLLAGGATEVRGQIPCGNFRNTTAITIPATGTGASTGAPANPYPSNIVVAGLSGIVLKVTVKLNGLTHTFPNDIDILLVGPGGQNAIIMSDVGGGAPGATNVTLTLNDAAATALPAAGPLVTGTFQPTNTGAGDLFPAPAPAPAGGSALSIFNGAAPNGTWSLYVVDDLTGDTGTIAGGWELTITTASCAPFTNTTAITIPATGTGATTGAPANPYPSNIAVAGVGGTVTNVTVKLNSLSHTFPNDIDILLVGPGGQNAIIMSDVGGIGPGATGVTLTLDDAAATALPAAGPLVTGTFKPTNTGTGDLFPAPAPAPAGGSALSIFNGTSPNGTWSLFVVDDQGGDVGSIAGGWELTITTAAPTPTPSPTPSPTASPTPSSSPTPTPMANCGLANISTRGVVQTGENILIGGLIITGTVPKRVVIRAIVTGVPNALPDPVLELYQGSTLIGTNDNWRTTVIGGLIMADQVAALIATTIAPTNDLESAIVLTLAPGPYTAQVRGKGAATGGALVEVYGL
jgi:subtilisin-like proprotein convertase family protein